MFIAFIFFFFWVGGGCRSKNEQLPVHVIIWDRFLKKNNMFLIWLCAYM